MAGTILLVEDEAILAMSEKQLLEKHGYDVVHVFHGEDALQIVRTRPEINLVLMDIDLGRGIDGTEAAERILGFRKLPILFLSSHTEKSFVDRVKKIAGYGYVLKNSGEFVLTQSIEMAYSLFRANRDARNHLGEIKRVNHEIDAQKRRLQHLNRVLISIRNLNRLIIEEDDPVALLDRSCGVLIEQNGYERAWIVLLENGQPREPFFHCGFNEGFAAMTQQLQRGELPRCARLALKTGETVMTEYPAVECPSCVFSGSYGGSDLTTMTAPLLSEDGPLGWISVLVPKSFSRFRDEQKLFSEIAGDISYALRNLRLKQELGDREEKYHAIFDGEADALFLVDAQSLLLLDANSSAVDTYAYERSAFNGMHCSQLFSKDYRYLLKSPQELMEMDGKMIMHQNSDQEPFPVYLSLSKTQVRGQVVIIMTVHRSLEGEEFRTELCKSEACFRQFFDQLNEGVAIYRPTEDQQDFVISDMNSRGLELSDKRKAEIIGHSVLEVFPGVRELGLYKLLFEVYRDGRARYLPMSRYRDKDLVEWVTNYVFKLPSGFIVAVYNDITRLKEVEIEMQNNWRIIESLNDAVIKTDLGGCITYWNSGAQQLYGYSREEVEGEPVTMLYPPGDRPLVDKMLQQLREGAEPSFENLSCLDKAGEEIHISLSLRHVRNDEGEISELMGLTRRMA